ncbi:hypothetical protein M8J76_005970 [Diaphorina citri]|nr:hypothetical protein M8J76_005970 [Diaphorina citri]KAI5746397.1 hypothetical protein M8J77_003166 [Diaphorina citri]
MEALAQTFLQITTNSNNKKQYNKHESSATNTPWRNPPRQTPWASLVIRGVTTANPQHTRGTAGSPHQPGPLSYPTEAPHQPRTLSYSAGAPHQPRPVAHLPRHTAHIEEITALHPGETPTKRTRPPRYAENPRTPSLQETSVPNVYKTRALVHRVETPGPSPAPDIKGRRVQFTM